MRGKGGGSEVTYLMTGFHFAVISDRRRYSASPVRERG
jgi:hypothetical protein